MKKVLKLLLFALLIIAIALVGVACGTYLLGSDATLSVAIPVGFVLGVVITEDKTTWITWINK